MCEMYTQVKGSGFFRFSMVHRVCTCAYIYMVQVCVLPTYTLLSIVLQFWKRKQKVRLIVVHMTYTSRELKLQACRGRQFMASSGICVEYWDRAQFVSAAMFHSSF